MRACPRCLTVYQTDPEYCAFDGVQTGLYTEDADPLVGARLDAFRLEARLGIGGTGCVYRGTQLPQGEPVAIKLLFGEMATDKALAQRFRREAEAMRRIDHPNVVSVLACATSAVGLTYLVMEFVEGRTLKAIIEDEAPLSPGRVGRLAEQLVAGIGQAHRLGYVHRDLKPSNIIVRGAPGSEQAKILDFGIVASLQGETGDHRLTKTGYIVGTPTYMAPEQVDPRAVSPQVDVYALGAIFYELLTGKPPFTGTLEQILVAKMTSPAPRLTSVGELGDLVNRMLATEPEDRPPTALHVSAELARFSLLSSDPATERARVPSLADVGVVGFGQVTVQIVDHTVPTALTDGAARDTVEGPWSAPTRLTAETLERDTPEDAFEPFNDDGPTTTALLPDEFLTMDPPRDPVSDTYLDPPLDIPTTLSAPPRMESFGVEPRTDEVARAAREGEERSASTGPAAPSAPSGPTGLDAPRPSEPSRAPQPRWADPVTTPWDDSAVSGAEDDPHEPTEDEVAFADTRIRPAHLDPLGPPHWSAPDPSRVGVSASSSSLPVFALPEIQDDGPTRLSLLPPDEDDVLEPPDDDPGDGETALDLSLGHPVRAPDEPIPGFVNGPRTAPMRPLGGRPRERWLLGLLLATSVVVAAALAYAILVKDAPTVITVPPAPGAQTSG